MQVSNNIVQDCAKGLQICSNMIVSERCIKLSKSYDIVNEAHMRCVFYYAIKEVRDDQA